MKKVAEQKNERKNERGVALIWTYLMSIFLLTMLTSAFTLSTFDVKYTAIETQRTQAFYLAEAAVDLMLAQIRTNNTNAINSDSNQTPLNQLGTYQAIYNSSTGVVTATGTVGNISKTVEAKLKGVGGSIPPGVLAALTANTNGKRLWLNHLTIDGRNHDTNGNLIRNSTGIAGVAYDRRKPGSWPGKVEIGGYDIAPSRPANPLVEKRVETMQRDTSVDTVLGIESGSTVLDQYVQEEPPKKALVDEVYYYEAQKTKKNPTTKVELRNGSGIMIIKSSDQNKYSRLYLYGSFKGLVIAEGFREIRLRGSSTIIGALVSISSKNTHIRGMSGYRKNKVLFSEATLKNLPAIEGAGYTPQNAKVETWTDATNGQNRLKVSQATMSTGNTLAIA